MDSEVIVDMPGTCVDGRFGIVVGVRDYEAVQALPAERRYVVELAEALDADPNLLLHPALQPTQIDVLYLRREELIHAAW